MTTVEKGATDISSTGTASFLSNLQSALDLSASTPEENDSRVSRYYYTVGSYNLLIEQNLKVENLTQTKINQVPYMPEWHKGIISIRGIVMPVIDIHAFIQSQLKVKEKSETNTNNSFLLMLEHENHSPLILQIDKLPELVDIERYKKIKANKKLPNWVEQNLKQGSKTIMQVNHKELLQQLINSQ